MAYYFTVSPPLASDKVRRAFFDVLCRSSVTEAFYFTRRNDDLARRSYLEQLIIFVLKSSPGQERGKYAMELISLPFDSWEEEWFDEVLLKGSTKSLQGAKDMVMMRHLATRKLDGLTSELESLEGKKIDGLNWNDMKQRTKRAQVSDDASG